MKTLWAGAGVALAAGLTLGAAMRPDLSTDDRPVGPQIFEGWSGARSTGPFDDSAVSYASYAGKVPDYVFGTDAKRLQNPVVLATAEAPPAAAPRRHADDDGPPLRPEDLTPAAFDAGSATDPADDMDVDAPPDATGDTRTAN